MLIFHYYVLLVAPPVTGCQSNDECPSNEACVNRQCQNPCDCGGNAFCRVVSHYATCFCLEGYTGDPFRGCLKGKSPYSLLIQSSMDTFHRTPAVEIRRVKFHTCVFAVGCRSESECADELACYNTKCVDPCLIQNPCAYNAKCFGRNHRAQCECEPGLEGDPFVRCTRLGCRTHDECLSTQICLEKNCVNPCHYQNPCASNAICTPYNHATTW